MAWIEADAIFDPDTMAIPIIGISSELVKHNSGEHQHNKGQLLFAREGSMRVVIDQKLSVIPPQKAVWLPPNQPHCVFFTEVVGYRSIYIDTEVFPDLPKEPATWSCSPLLKCIMEEIAQSDWATDWQLPSRGAHWLLVLWDELKLADREEHYLELPRDYRIQKFDLLTYAPPLSELAKHIGASERTITRIFLKETGLNYQSWRQQWRLFRAIELLSEQRSMMDIALTLGFANDSAFSTFFKNMTGSSPTNYSSVDKSQTEQEYR